MTPAGGGHRPKRPRAAASPMSPRRSSRRAGGRWPSRSSSASSTRCRFARRSATTRAASSPAGLTSSCSSSATSPNGTLQERVLQRERDFSRAVVRSTPSFLALVDENGTLLGVNRALERAAGIPEEAWLGHPFWKLFIAEEDVPRAREDFVRMRDGEPPGTRRVRARRPGGRAPRRRLDRDDRARRRGRAPLPPVRARRDGPQAGRGGDPALAGAHRLGRRRGAKAARAEPPRRRPAEPRHRHALDPPRGPVAPHRPGESRGAPRASAGRAERRPTRSSASSRAASTLRS